MSAPKFIDVLSDAVAIGTTGIVDVQKGRFNVPFSSAQGRTAAKALINTGAQHQLDRKEVNEEFDRPVHRTGSAAAGTLAATIAGAGVGGAIAGGAGAGAGVAGGGAAAGSAGGSASGSLLGAGLGGTSLGTIAGGAVGATAGTQMGAIDAAKEEEKALKQLFNRTDTPLTPTLTPELSSSVRKRRSFSTLLTNPRGLTDKATVFSPTLLGRAQGRPTLG